MTPEQQRELSGLIDRYALTSGVNQTVIPRVSLYKAVETNDVTPNVYNASLCFIAQGRKQAMLGKDVYSYGASDFLIISTDMPMMAQITEASVEIPYLVLKIDIDLSVLSELMLHFPTITPPAKAVDRGVYLGQIDQRIGDGLVRLARLLEHPEDIPVLAAQTIREILYRSLSAAQGGLLAQLALKGSHIQRISAAIGVIKENFQKPLSVDCLAEVAGMSVSGFHAHFKSVTAMSPLQFQKTLRLVEARSLMFAGDYDVAAAAYEVGYESPSQFNREYTRMFGNAPRRDITRLKCDGVEALG